MGRTRRLPAHARSDYAAAKTLHTDGFMNPRDVAATLWSTISQPSVVWELHKSACDPPTLAIQSATTAQLGVD